MRLTNHANLPNPIVQAIAADPYSRGDSDFSPSSLITPARIRALRRYYDDELEEDASERIWALLGSLGHAIIERAASEENGITEMRLFANCAGARISGKFDYLSFERRISDYKFTSTYAVRDGVKPEWEASLNVYRWLAAENGVAVEELEIVAIFRDAIPSRLGGTWIARDRETGKEIARGSKVEVRRRLVLGRWKPLEIELSVEVDVDHPAVPTVSLPVTLWTLEETIAYVRERVEAHRTALENLRTQGEESLPECTPEERWYRPGKYAVYKGKNKRATRLFEENELREAEDFALTLEKPRVEYRPGESPRCDQYCPVALFCEQYRRNLEGEVSNV